MFTLRNQDGNGLVIVSKRPGCLCGANTSWRVTRFLKSR